MSLPRTGPGRPAAKSSYEPTPARPPEEKRGPWAALLFLLAPLLCCGPLILAALATASAATLGTVGGIIGGLLAAVAVALWVRHRRRTGAACCPPVPGAWRR